MPVTSWGDTCPLLKIARHFGVDYAVTLAFGDWMIHGRDWVDRRLTDGLGQATIDAIYVEVRKVARRYRELSRGEA